MFTRRALLVAAALVAAACSSGSATTTTSTTVATTTSAAVETTTSTAPAEFPVTVTAANGEVTIEERPEAIVSLSPTHTEMLFAVGAGEQVVAVDEFSNYPPEAPTTDLSGFTPNVEAIASYDPDLVVIAFDPGDLVASLEQLGIPVLAFAPAETLDDLYGQVETVGAATGNLAEAEEVAEQIRVDIEEILIEVGPVGRGLSVYHELDTTYFTATSASFIGQIYQLFQLENIADAAGEGQYLQLSPEYIVEADPDLIFLADVECCGVTAETVAQRPGWDQITAVQQGNVFELDNDVASRWGPRVVEFVRTVADAVLQARAGA